MNSIVKIGHKILSNRYAYSCYQYSVGGTQYRDRAILEALNLVKPRSILDLGCGPGPTLRVLPSQIDFHGVDLSSDYLKLAHKKRPSANLILGDVTSKEWHKDVSVEKLDLVLAMGLFHHLDLKQMEILVKNLSELLPAGAKIFSVDPTIKSDSSNIARWFANNDRGKYVRSPLELVELFPNRYFSAKMIIREKQFHIPLDTVELVLERI